MAQKGCRGGRRQHQAAADFKSLTGSVSNGCTCLAGVPDSVQLSEICMPSECYVWLCEIFPLYNLLGLFGKCMVMGCCVVCEQMLLVLGVVWLQLGFQRFEFCGRKRDH